MTRLDDETNINPTKVRPGKRNPIELNSFLVAHLLSIPPRISLSLITPVTIIASQHVMNGIDDSSPFF